MKILFWETGRRTLGEFRFLKCYFFELSFDVLNCYYYSQFLGRIVVFVISFLTIIRFGEFSESELCYTVRIRNIALFSKITLVKTELCLPTGNDRTKQPSN